MKSMCVIDNTSICRAGVGIDWRLKRLESMMRGSREHHCMATRLIAKHLLSRAYLEPVFSVQIRYGRHMAVLLDNGQVSVDTHCESVESVHMLYAA